MAQIIIFSVFSFFAILGLSEALHILRLIIYKPTKNNENVLIIIPQNCDFQRKIINTAEQRRWYGASLADRIIVINNCLSPENFKECKLLAEHFKMELCSAEDIKNTVLRECEA